MRISNFKGFKGFCLVSLSALLLNSCYNEPQFLGNNLIPDDDKYAIKIDTLFELSAYTIRPTADTITYSSGVFGYINNEIYGSTKASFVSRYITTESTEGFGGTTAKPDSLFFIFTPSSTSNYYGDSSKTLAINVHELTDTSVLWKPDVLKSIDGKYNPVPLFYTTFKGGQKSLKVPIDTSFARFLMDSLALTNYKLFYSRFKGLYVTCEDISGNGGVAYQVGQSSFKLELYYHYTQFINNKDSVFKKSKILYSSPWLYFQYIHDYSKANPAKEIKYLNDSTIQDSVFYTQGLSGVYGKIQFDGVTQWLDSMPIVLHKAELLVSRYTPETITPDSTIKTLNFRYKIDNKWILTQSGYYSYLGSLRLYSNDYKIDITSHLQRVLEGEIKDRNLYVFPDQHFKENSSVVLYSGNNNSRKMKLRLTYTKLR